MKKVKSNKINLIVYQIDSNYTEKIIKEIVADEWVNEMWLIHK